jgi:hypothetical protein
MAVELVIRRLEIRGVPSLSCCVDPKIAAYYQVIRGLEGKFHGLELYHELCDYNKAANLLTKTALSRKPVPHGVFVSDQHAPSV